MDISIFTEVQAEVIELLEFRLRKGSGITRLISDRTTLKETLHEVAIAMFYRATTEEVIELLSAVIIQQRSQIASLEESVEHLTHI